MRSLTFLRTIILTCLIGFVFFAQVKESVSGVPNKQMGLGITGVHSSPSGRYVVISTGPSKAYWSYDSYALVLLDTLTGQFHFLPILQEPTESFSFDNQEKKLIVTDYIKDKEIIMEVDVFAGSVTRRSIVTDSQSKPSIALGEKAFKTSSGMRFEFEQLSSTVTVSFQNKIVGTFHVYPDALLFMTDEGYFAGYGNFGEYVNIRSGLMGYSIRQLYDVFYRPDIVTAKLRGEEIDRLITITVDDALKSPPPAIRITSYPRKSSSHTAKVCYEAKSTGGGIGEVRLFQNGKLVKSDGFYRESLARTDSSAPVQLASLNGRSLQNDMRRIAASSSAQGGFMQAKPKGDTFRECVDIEAAPGENELAVYAFNGTNTVQSMPATATFTSSRPATEPHLYILSIGIDRFNDKNANLKYAVKDAQDMAASIPQKAQGIFKPANIHTMQIADSQATKTEIKKQIDAIAHKIKPWDSFILFIASHGVMLGNQYYVVTSQYNGNLNDTTKLISSNEIVEMSKSIKSLSQLYIFDTCHAGGVDTIVSGLYDARMSVMAKKMGLHIYASAGSLQTAIDGYQGNGLFTYNLLSGIRSGKDADSNKDGKVSVVELGQYAKQKTTDVSTKIGHPQTPNIISFGKDAPILGVR